MTLRQKLIELLGGNQEPEPLDTDDLPVVDECSAGGEHEWKAVQPATSRVPLFTYCTRCRLQKPLTKS